MEKHLKCYQMVYKNWRFLRTFKNIKEFYQSIKEALLIKAIHFAKKNLSEVFVGKGVLKISTKFTGEHPFRNVISIKLESNFT